MNSYLELIQLVKPMWKIKVWILIVLISYSCTRTYNEESPLYVENLFPEKGLTDPHNIIVGDRLYVFCGHDKSWDTESSWMMDRWEIYSTNNLIDWKKEGQILPTETYIGDKANCWAGDIVKRNEKYYWYFSNRNIDTGVLVSDSPKGPFKDVLGKPLLPKGIIGKGHPYDPDIYEEDGVYTLFFGAGHYWAVTLNDDMISLKGELKKIKVTDKLGKDKWTADKSTVFKNGDYYYLVWGANYAMSKNLYGPYVYEGKFVAGGHNSVFKWKNQWYALTENKDISLFYRGVSLKPFGFNTDGTIKLPKNDKDFPENGREWSFANSTMGWKNSRGEPAVWNSNKKTISVSTTTSRIIESALWTITNLKQESVFSIRFKNKSSSTKIKVYIASYNPNEPKYKGNFWKKTAIDWNDQMCVELDVKPNSNELQSFQIDLSDYKKKLKPFLKRVRLEFENSSKGDFELDYIAVKNRD